MSEAEFKKALMEVEKAIAPIRSKLYSEGAVKQHHDATPQFTAEWRPSKTGKSEWTFATDQAGARRSELAPLIAEIMQAGGKKEKDGYVYMYDTLRNNGKFLTRFPANRG